MMGDERIESALARIERLLRASVKLQMGSILEKELKDDFERALYAFTGKVTQREIQKRLKVGPARISATWQRWERLGLVVKDGKGYQRTVKHEDERNQREDRDTTARRD